MSQASKTAETTEQASVGKTHYVRVAVVQMEYHPAIKIAARSAIEDPGGVTFLFPPNDTLPEVLWESFAKLQGRIRNQYNRYMARKVKRILGQCDLWGVRVVVFPEYSIPWQILPELAKVAPNIVVVAGTHTVDKDSKHVYEQLGWSKENTPKLAQSVAPVLFEGKLLGLSGKFHPAVAVGEKIVAAKTWQTISMPPGIPGPMGVMVCLDFLHRENQEYRTLVGDQLDKCHFLAVPSLTPSRSLDRFENKGWEEVKGYGRPVIYTNDSKEGGATIFVDEKERSELNPFPEHVGQFVAKDEGVIVADVDLGFKRAGGSGRLDGVAPVHPFAMASLVYRARPAENVYSGWLDGLRSILGDAIDDLDDDQVERFHGHVRTSRGILVDVGTHSAARTERLKKLRARLENITFVEDIRRLTREVELEPQVLPFGAFCAAMAKGASREIERWVVKHGQLGTVLSRLREPLDKLEREMATWTQEARLEASDVMKAVAGENVPHDPKGQIPIVEVYEGEIGERFREEYKKAQKAAEELRFADERAIYQALQQHIEGLRDKTEPHDAKDRPFFPMWTARCRLHAALVSLNLQEIEAAREQLLTIPLDDLQPTDRMHLAEGLALVGEIDRARAILPDKDTIPAAKRDKYEEVEQSLDLLDGRLPEKLAESEMVLLRAAPVYLENGNRAEAARLARRVLAKKKNDLLIAPLAIQYLTEALRCSIIEMPPESDDMIAASEYGRIINELEAYFNEFPREKLPEAARKHLQRVETVFRVLIDDSDWLTLHGELLNDDNDPFGDPEHPRNVAFRLAKEGRFEEALRFLPNDHHWSSRLDRIGLLVIANKSEQAMDELLTLAKEYESNRKVPIESKTARLLDEHGRIEEALPYAKRAFELFPTIGHRIQLAELLQLNDQPQKAWDLLKDENVRQRPRVLRARGIIAEKLGNLDAAEDAWGAYLELRPQDGRARVHWAEILFARHKSEKAAEVAWKAFVEQSDRLELDALFSCGRLQRLAGPANKERERTEQERRIKEIALKILRRFPGDAKAEQLRLELLRMMGKLPEDQPIDFPKLVEAGYATRQTGFASFVKFLDDRRARTSAVEFFRKRGAVPLTTSCAFGGARLALVVTRILEHSRIGAGFLSSPVSFVDQPPAMQLDGARILVSDLELLLIETLELAPLLKEALGKNGQLVVFDKTYNRIVQDAAQLRIDARPEELQKKEALLRKVERLPRVDADLIAPFDDLAAARRVNAAMVEYNGKPASDGVVRISSRAFLNYLHAQRVLDDEQYGRILPAFADEAEPTATVVDPLPKPIILPPYWIDELENANALDATFSTYRDVLRVGPWTLRQIGDERDQLLAQIRAHELADRVHALVNEPWIEKTSEPEITELPPLITPTKTYQQLFWAPLHELLAYKKQLLAQQGWWRLSAEFFGSTTLGALETMQEFAWESNEQYVRLEQQVQEANAREFTLPSLVRLLVKDQRTADERLLKLAELGFPDALGAGELLRLERRYKGLNTGEPKRILDHQEWMARELGHLGGDFARLRLAQTYATAIFVAFSTPQRTDAERDALLKTLLHRQEDIAKRTQANTLDVVLAHLAGRTAHFWQGAFTEEGEFLVQSPEGSTGKLWRALFTWLRADNARIAAHGRAQREIWRALHAEPGGPPPEMIAALDLMHEPLPEDGLEISLMAPGYEALAILSAVWKENPFQHKIHAELLKRGAELLAENGVGLQGGRQAQYRVVIDGDAVATQIRLPVEALLLLLPSESRGKIAGRLKLTQGVYDRRAYELLEAIEKAPEDEALRHHYADHAAGALFRLVQDDPAFLYVWPQAQFGPLGKLGKFDLLLEVLSEPPAPLDEDKPIRQILHDRIESPEGFWHDRIDSDRLLKMVTEVPGVLATQTLPGKFHDTAYAENVESALDRIDHPDEHPAGRLAADMFFLRAASVFRPLVRISATDIDLRDELPARFHKLLARVIDEPKPDTLAAFEPALLQCCAATIQRLAGPQLTIKWGVWLTWRLFQWLHLQLEAISPDARLSGMRRLTANVSQFGAPMDRLDPAGFGRNKFDHRLAAALHALGGMDIAASFARDAVEGVLNASETKIFNGPGRNVSSPEIEQLLLSLAQQVSLEPSLTSKLDWNAPGTVPDLALFALLGMNPTRFVDLSVETRTRYLEKLPQDLEALIQLNGSDAELAQRIVFAAANGAGKLSPNERQLLEDKMIAIKEDPRVEQWRPYVFACLYATGADHLEQRAWEAMYEQLGKDHLQNSLTLVSRLLVATADRDPARLESKVDEVIEAATKLGVDGGALIAGGLARVVGAGKPGSKKMGRTLLAKLANHPELGNHPSMREVRGFFGIKGETS